MKNKTHLSYRNDNGGIEVTLSEIPFASGSEWVVDTKGTDKEGKQTLHRIAKFNAEGDAKGYFNNHAYEFVKQLVGGQQ